MKAKPPREFRCPHSFYRSQVRCVKCDAAEKLAAAAPPVAAAPSSSTGQIVQYKCGRKYESKQVKRVYRCRDCGQVGHSKATCPRLPAPVPRGARPNLTTYPIPAEHAEPAPKRTGTR